jgi:CMP-N-acetylneuraminic acid synthetase
MNAEFAPPAVLLLGRKGSQGLPGKNTMMLLGRKIIYYPISAAKASKHVKFIFTSTDDEEIINEAKKYDSELIERPAELCTDEALFEDAVYHGFQEIVRRLGKPPEFLVILMCNACTVNSSLIDEAIEMLRADETADSAVTVSVYNMWSPMRARKLNTNGYLDPFVPFEYFGDPQQINCDRDSQGDVYFADMSHSVCRPRCFDNNMKEGLLPQKWMGKKILPVKNSFGCDIDYDWQVPLTEYWLKKDGILDGSIDRK